MAQNPDFTETLKQTTDRNRYFYGKLMTVRDFLQEQQYFNNKRWLINRLLFGSGIVCGLEASWGGTGTTEIQIEPGVGFDQIGREITVLNSTKVDVKNLDIAPPQTGSHRRVQLCLAYHECPKEPVPSVKSSPCDEVCESNRLSETFTFELRDAADAPPAAALCDQWLNRHTEERHTNQLRIERTAPTWVRADEVFEVALKVTALADTAEPIRITEKETGDGTFIEPTPPPTGQASQFPTPPVMLRTGEFFIYVYQMKAPPLSGATTTKNINISNTLIPTLTTTVEVIKDDAARRREVALRFGECSEKAGVGNPCLAVASLKIHFSGSQIVSVSEFTELDVPRRYNLARVGQLLDCLRANLQAEAGSARPGHAFITFKDTERNDALPVSHTAKPGTSFTVSRGDHTHALLLHEDSGLEFPNGQDLIRINGNVGGERINFLNNVSGQTPKNPEHLVTKSYVDGKVAGLDWQESVVTKELREPPPRPPDKLIIDKPKLPREGDRYLLYHSDLKGKWEGRQNQIATRDGAGDDWIFTVPDEATAVFVEAEKVAYLYVAATRTWTPFLATPELAAGNGLIAAGAFLSVGEGAGLHVGADEVSVVYRGRRPLAVGMDSAAGTTDEAARGDHSHELPLARRSGLEFIKDDIYDKDIELPDDKYERDFVRLRINGLVGGEAVEFEYPVSGQLPLLPRHFATKQYVDTKLAGLDWQESVKTKDFTEPPPIRRTIDDVDEEKIEPPIDEKRPPATDEEKEAAPESETEILSPPIIKPPIIGARPGDRFLLFHDKLGGDWEGQFNNIATLTAGRDERLEWAFITPTEGTAVFVEDENTAYIFAEGKWSAFLAMPTVAAGNGLVADGAVLSVGGGAGLRVTENEVSLEFESDARGIQPVGTRSDSGVAATVARGDHTHEFPLVDESGIEYALKIDDSKEEEAKPQHGLRGFRINGAIGGEKILFRHPVEGAEPVEPQHLATKNYVDTAVAGLDWQSSVLRADLTSPPVEPGAARGDRFLILTNKPEGDWAEHAGHIAIKASRGWSYKEPDEGMAVFVEDRNISFLYADGKWTEFLAAPPPITAGDGLFRNEDTLNVGQGDGIVVNPNAVSLAYPENPPPPVGTSGFLDTARLIGQSKSAARSDHTHLVPLASDSGIEYVEDRNQNGLRINGTIGGRDINFLSPVAGQNPTLAQHLTTKDYVDKKQVNIDAGVGLTRSGNTLSVKPGAGIGVDYTGVAVAYSNDTPQPLGTGSPGAATFASRGDHVHPIPQRTTGTTSGVFDFFMERQETFTASGVIPLDKESDLFFVQVGLITEDGRVIYGDIAGNARDRGYPPISLAAEVIPINSKLGGGFGFRIVASSPDPLPSAFRVRYIVFRPFGTEPAGNNTNEI